VKPVSFLWLDFSNPLFDLLTLHPRGSQHVVLQSFAL